MRDDLASIIAHGRRELDQAETALTQHEPAEHGLCGCMRPLPCQVAEQWQAYARYWRARLAEHERKALTAPTMALPTIAAGSHPRLR